MKPWQVAFLRGLGSAIVVGALSFLAVWATSDDGKTLVIAGLTPFLTTLAIRFGLEGAVDSRRPTPPPV